MTRRAVVAFVVAMHAPALAVAQAPRNAASRPAQPAPRGDARPVRPLSELQAEADRQPSNPARHVALGLARWDAGDFPGALSAFQRAVSVGPSSAEAHNWLGVALAEQGDLPGAIAMFEKAIALDPTFGRAYSNLGSSLATSGDVQRAVAVFEKALTLEPNSIAAQRNLGMALREVGSLDRALEYLRRVAAAARDDAANHLELGQTLRLTGDLEGARTSLERSLEIEPESREAYYALGMTLRQQAAALRTNRPAASSPADEPYQRARDAMSRGEWRQAREHLDAAVRLDERHAASRTLLGYVAGQQGDLATAVDHLRRAVALDASSADAHHNLGVALWYRGARDEALRELREALTRDPSAGAHHAFLGAALRDAGDLAGARASLQRAIALLPPTAAVYVDLATTFLREGRVSAAIGQLEAALNAPPPSVPVPDWSTAIADLRKAMSSASLRSDRKAVGGTKKASERSEASPRERSAPSERRASERAGESEGRSPSEEEEKAEAHNTLGRMLGRINGDPADVSAAFREAIRLDPRYAEAYNNLGLVLIQAGDDHGGIAALREAVKIDPDYADAQANLGAALTPTDADEAVRALERAVALTPASISARFNLAIAYGADPARGGQKEIDELQAVVKAAPAFARAHLALGKALVRSGKVADGIAALQEAARLEPSSGEAHYQLGLGLARAGRKEEASEALRKGRELVAIDERNQNVSLDIAEGRAALAKGELEQALTRFRHALQLDPSSADSHRLLGQVLERRGDASGALAAYSKAVELNPGDPIARRRAEALTAASSADDRVRIGELEGFIRDGRFAEVEPLLIQYVKQRPVSSWGWYALGYAYFAQQKIGESIKALSTSLQLDIRNAEAHKILGRTLMIVGRFDAAQIEFEQGLRYKPDSAELHYNLGKLFSIQDNWEPARKALEEALRIDPGYVEALDGLGFAQEALGDDAAAVATYERAIATAAEKRVRVASPHINLSAYYNRTGDAEQAGAHADRALEIDPKSDRALFQKARADERRGKLEEAVKSLNDAIVLNPNASSYYYVLSGIYRRLGWQDESRKALDAFKRLERDSRELEKKRRGGGSGPSGVERQRE